MATTYENETKQNENRNMVRAFQAWVFRKDDICQLWEANYHSLWTVQYQGWTECSCLRDLVVDRWRWCSVARLAAPIIRRTENTETKECDNFREVHQNWQTATIGCCKSHANFGQWRILAWKNWSLWSQSSPSVSAKCGSRVWKRLAPR